MAIRRFEIPGKIINTTFSVDTGPSGEFAVDVSADAGITQDASSITGAANSKKITLSMWFNPANLGSANLFVCKAPSVNSALNVLQQSTGRITLQGGNGTGGGFTLSAQSLNNHFQNSVWNHLLVSVDAALGFPNGLKVYVNDSAVSWNGTPTLSDAAFGLAESNIRWFVCNESSTYITLSTDGCVGLVWFDIDRFVDFDVTANRRLFIDANGRPVRLGASGQVPFGAEPICYFDNPATTFANNRGSGGDFRYITGNTLDSNGLTNCADTPDTGTLFS